jgi:hypothetical protein
MNTHTETCPAPTPTTRPYTNGFGYWYLTVKQARQAAAASIDATAQGIIADAVDILIILAVVMVFVMAYGEMQ